MLEEGELIHPVHAIREAMVRSDGRKKAAVALGGLSLMGMTGLLAIMAVLAAGAGLHASTAKNQKPAKAAAATASAPVKVYGSKNAPITMEIFTDYQCPTCGNLFEQTLRPMINDYVASGKVYVIHHDFPLQMHAYSGQAARWANAAAEVGQFDAVEAALYDNQAAWTASGDLQKYVSGAMSNADFKRVQKAMEGCEPPGPTAKPGGIAPSPHPCSLDAFIVQDITAGNLIPVTGTPMYIIYHKGQKLPAMSGFVSWPILKQFFDSLLAQ
jgi:protein-disulfide isomerase